MSGDPVKTLHASVSSRLEQLCQSIDPATPLYVLVDPLGGEPVLGIDSSSRDPTSQREQVWERQIITVPLARHIALPPPLHPYLVRLRGPDDPLLALTIGLAQEERLAAQSGGFEGEGGAAHTIAGWLQSPMGDTELAEALSDMCRVNTDVATRATYLRQADRRVLDLLCHVAGEDRVACQLGRIHSWTYLNPIGELRFLRSPQKDRHALCLGAPEWQRLARSERLHRTVSTYLGAQAAAQQPIGQFDYGIVEAAVLAAEVAAKTWPHRFRSNHDHITWAALTMSHPSLLHLGSVHGLMADLGSQDEPPEPVRYLYADLRTLVERTQASA